MIRKSKTDGIKHAATHIRWVTTQLAVGFWCVSGALAAPPIPEEDRTFFEARIRPVLVERCHRCHSHQAKMLKANLLLDTHAGILRGSDTGVVVIPGSPDSSRLIQALRYNDPNLQMPPKGKLPDRVIEDFTEWIQRGAPWPEELTERSSQITEPSAGSGSAEWLQRRSQHWAYQPIEKVIPPKLPNENWGQSDIDRFIARGHKAAGLSPAPPTDRRTLIRRATYNLTGLPPAPEDIEQFLNDQSPHAFAKVVDRLLASPRYGERWARHWLDLVRYSETLGFEFDFDLYHAWRYRDYVIRAYNLDLPYNEFVIEHLAGDLLPLPRRRPENQTNESVVATGFFWMEEGRQSPVDIRQEQTDVIDGQINVLGKAFLGQTIACARCHDHKFDAITTRDYYALAGYLKSSRYQNAFIDPPSRHEPAIRQLVHVKKQIHQEVLAHLAPIWKSQLTQIHHYLLTASRATAGLPTESPGTASTLDEGRLKAWTRALKKLDAEDTSHPLQPWIQLTSLGSNPGGTFEEKKQHYHNELNNLQASGDSDPETSLFADFDREDNEAWQATGSAFAQGPAPSGDFILGPEPGHPLAAITLASAHSGLLSDRFQGDLRSQTFTLTAPFIHCLIAGENARLNLIIDGYRLIMNPMYGGLTLTTSTTSPHWETIDVQQWLGHRAYFEISDSSIPRYRLNPPPSKGKVSEKPSGYTALYKIVFSSSQTSPTTHSTSLKALLRHSDSGDVENLTSLAKAYSIWAARSFELWSNGDATQLTQTDIHFLNWLLSERLLVAPPDRPSSYKLARLFEQYHEIERHIPSPRRAPAMTDGTGEDEYVLVRGSHRNRGVLAPRQIPEVFTTSLPSADKAPASDPAASDGSHRLSLATQLTDASNPLLTRVMVNRIWQHHFGEGIVRTPDDFGHMGQLPSHPELLDYLASEFIRSGWSIKSMHRKILLSDVFQMSSQSSSDAQGQDPDNRLLHHFPIRRLEAEAIRDSILSVSGRLDDRMEGPSILPFLTAHMEGRGRPESGPLDGAGRRSIYINTRRNFLTPLFVAYDYPAHFSTQGKRVVSAVPEQAMTLLNDPFVAEQANHWAQRLLSLDHQTPSSRIRIMFQAAYSRDPSPTEIAQATAFLNQHKQWHDCDLTDPRPWADLAHVLFNVKEFIFID